MNRTTLTACAALLAMIVAGGLTADVVAKEGRSPTGLDAGLDPAIEHLLSDIGAPLGDALVTIKSRPLTPRSIAAKVYPAFRNDARIKVKFADDLRLRLDDQGQPYSTTGKQTATIAAIVDQLGIQLRPAVETPQHVLDDIRVRAERYSGTMQPDWGGLYWVVGDRALAQAAADAFFYLDDVEYVMWAPIFTPGHMGKGPPVMAELPSPQLLGDRKEGKAKPRVDSPQGACAVTTSDCRDSLTKLDCEQLGGTFLGKDSVCGSAQTLRDDWIPVQTGDVLEKDLVDGGEYRGSEVGACCVSAAQDPVDGCVDGVSADGCANLGGFFQGVGGTCATAPCGGIGACCVNFACDSDNETNVWCTQFLGGSFQGSGTVCDDVNCTNGPCCTIVGCISVPRTQCLTMEIGIWFGDDPDINTCTDIEDVCLGPPDPDSYNLCGDAEDLITELAGDCYIDQVLLGAVPAIAGATFPIARNPSLGCFDSTSFPSPQSGGVPDPNDCCADVSAFVSRCDPSSDDAVVWDAICASYARSGFADCIRGSVFRPCEAPFGPVQLAAFTQRQVMLNETTCLFQDVANQGCATYANLMGTASGVTFQPVSQSGQGSPDYFSAGLQGNLTKETISFNDWGIANPAGNNLAPLLPWPMGGATIGSDNSATGLWYGAGYGIEDFPGNDDGTLPTPAPVMTDPVTGNVVTVQQPMNRYIGARIGSVGGIFTGEGINLYPSAATNDALDKSDEYGGLYGYGQYFADLNDIDNATFGDGVTMAVIDYAAYIQTYTNDAGVVYGADHEGLLNIKLEGRDTDHNNGVQVEMVFEENYDPDNSASWAFSADHGTAVLGVIAGSWDPDDPTAPTSTHGIRGIVPDAEVYFFPLVDRDSLQTGGRQDTAWINAMSILNPGDVLCAAYRPLASITGQPNLAYWPDTLNLIAQATSMGITVVIAAGDRGVDLSSIDLPNDGVDPLAIVAAGVSPGEPFKRWVDGRDGSCFTAASVDFSKITCAAWAQGVTTCGMGPSRDGWLGAKTILYNQSGGGGQSCDLQSIYAASYTNNFNGTTAAAAQVAGCVAAVQGFSLQLFGTPLSPLIARQLMGGGQVEGFDPDSGAPFLTFPDPSGLSTETNMTNGMDDAELRDTWDWIDVDAGAGNLVGNFVDPRQACQRAIVDPLWDNPRLGSLQVIRGDLMMGNFNSIAAQDGDYLAIRPLFTDGGIGVPAGVPGDTVYYNSTGYITDLYVTGKFSDGLPVGNTFAIDVTTLGTLPTNTVMQLHLWNYNEDRWWLVTQTILPAGSTDANFQILIANRFLDVTEAEPSYHARVVTINGADDGFGEFPVFIDQIRIGAASLPGHGGWSVDGPPSAGSGR